MDRSPQYLVHCKRNTEYETHAIDNEAFVQYNLYEITCDKSYKLEPSRNSINVHISAPAKSSAILAQLSFCVRTPSIFSFISSSQTKRPCPN